jgi:hypothetical protein
MPEPFAKTWGLGLFALYAVIDSACKRSSRHEVVATYYAMRTTKFADTPDGHCRGFGSVFLTDLRFWS